MANDKKRLLQKRRKEEARDFKASVARAFSPLVSRVESFKAEWDESQHPRDDHGRFGSGGGGEHSRDEHGRFGSGGGSSEAQPRGGSSVRRGPDWKEGDPPTKVSEGWQVGLSRTDGSPVTDEAEAVRAMRSIYPDAGGPKWEEALGRMQSEDEGVWLVPLPKDQSSLMDEEGYVSASSATHSLEGEMP